MFKTPFKQNFADWKSETFARKYLLISPNQMNILNSLSEWQEPNSTEIILNKGIDTKSKDGISKNTQKESQSFLNKYSKNLNKIKENNLSLNTCPYDNKKDFTLKEKSPTISLGALEKNNTQPKLKYSCSDSNLYLLKNKETRLSKFSHFNSSFDIDKVKDNKVQNSLQNEILRLKSLKMNSPTNNVSIQVNMSEVSTVAKNSLCFNQEKNLLSSKSSLGLKPSENKFIQQNFQTTEQYKPNSSEINLNNQKSTLDSSSVQVGLRKIASPKNAIEIDLRKSNTFVPLNKSEDFNKKDETRLIKQHEKHVQLLDDSVKLTSVKRKLDFLSSSDSSKPIHKQTSNKKMQQIKPPFKRRLFDDSSEISPKKRHLESRHEAHQTKSVTTLHKTRAAANSKSSEMKQLLPDFINFTQFEIKSMIEVIHDLAN